MLLSLDLDLRSLHLDLLPFNFELGVDQSRSTVRTRQCGLSPLRLMLRLRLERRSRPIHLSGLVGETTAGVGGQLDHALALAVSEAVEHGEHLCCVLQHPLLGFGVAGAWGLERANEPELADLAGE